MFDAVDAHWRDLFGNDEFDALRTCLVDVVGRLEFELSHYPVSYGSADTSITGGPGQDWTFRPRVDAGAVTTLPLSALLSQALVAFSIDYEKLADWSLAATVNVLRFLRDDGQNIKDVPPVGALRWHGLVIIEPGPGRTKLIRLSPRGRHALDSYEPLAADVERRWESAYGEDLVGRLRGSLEHVVGRLDGGLPQHPSMLLHL